ncbi:DNA-directed RNA polymerase III subunit RPC6 [Tyrophagus putrescentiae]|nr:DNA-directed RNA polymerase III subunit RPC6 [Tyrophagus putrescentiae]
MASASKDIADRLCLMIESSGGSSSRAISEQELRIQLTSSSVDSGQLQNALEDLKAKNRIRLVHASTDENGGALSIEAVNRRPTVPEDVVLELIKEGNTGGILFSDLRHQAKLSDDELKRALQALQKRGLIWKAKSITNKMVYTMAGLKADLVLTVARLKDACLKAVWERFEASYQQMVANIHFSEDSAETVNLDQTVAISAEELFEQLKRDSSEATSAANHSFQVDDVEQVLYILQCEGKLMKIEQPSKKSAIRYRFNPYYRVDRNFNSSHFHLHTTLFSAACMDCPEYQRCRPQSPQSAAAAAAAVAAMAGISPETCPHLDLDHLHLN